MSRKVTVAFLCAGLLATNVQAQRMPLIPLMVQPLQLQLPNPLQDAQQIEQIRALRLQNEQAEAQLKLLEAQARALEKSRQQQLEQRERQSQTTSQPDPVIEDWLRAAAPRMGLYPDFEKVVFSPDVPITTDMVRLITSSPLAADMAYYLGTHKMESLAISKMSLADAAQSLSQLEARLKSTKLP